MATSGTLNNTFRTGYAIRIVWEVTSQSIPNNTSSVTARVQLVSLGSSYTINSSASKSGSLTINGTKYNFSFTASLSGNQTKTIFTKSVTVAHGANGTKTCSFSATAGINVTLSGTYWGNVSVSGNGVFNTIPRASSISSVTSSVTAGNSVSVSISRASSSFTHTVVYKLGSYTSTQTGVGTSTSFTVPLTWCNALPKATSGTATVTVTTYSGSTKIGNSVSRNFNVTVPTTIVPSISGVTIAEAVSGLAAQFGAYVQDKSRLSVTVTASGAYSSTISSYRIVLDSVSYHSRSFTSDVLKISGSRTMTITVTDSRGRTVTTTRAVTVVAYTPPNIDIFTGNRALSTGVENYDGTYLSARIKFSIAPVNNRNNKTYSLAYKLKTATTWSTLTSGSVYSLDQTFLSATDVLNGNNSYDIRLTISDFFTSASIIFDIPTAFTLVDYKASGNGLAFGKVAEMDDVVEFGIPAYSGDGQFIRYPRHLSSNVDLNDILDAGFYTIPNTTVSATILNKPTTSTATAMISVGWGGNGVQKMQQFWMCDKTQQYMWQRVFYGGTWGAWRELLQYETDWQNLTLSSNFELYGDNANNQPKYRRVGHLVSLYGAITPVNSITDGYESNLIGTLPAGFRPSLMSREMLCQGSAANTWLLSVTTAGAVNMSRYRNGGAMATCNNGNWLSFTVTFAI